jgi:hypothetical protein
MPPDADWQAELLFPSAGSNDIAELKDYCLYTWIGVDTSPPDLSGVDWRSIPKPQQLAKDCAIVGPMQGGVASGLDEHARWMIGRLDRNAGRLTTTDDDGAPVRLAFLDTGPTNAVNPQHDRFFEGAETIIEEIADDGRVDASEAALLCGGRACSPHGFALVNIARRLLCPDNDCGGITITSQLAMPRVNAAGTISAPRTQGGVVAYLHDVATAVEREVDAWEAAGVHGERLILNLSLGWESCFGGHVADGHLLSSTEPTIKAVHDALSNAACKGALIVAAAGNFQGPPNYSGGPPLGPLFPGGWEALPRTPWSADDVDDLACPPGEPGPGEYKPLVHAVAGVDGGGRLIANSRPRSRPRFAAFGDHAVAPYPVLGIPGAGTGAPSPLGLVAEATPPLTGTSVSAAVVSAAAAARWSAEGSAWSAAQVMDALWVEGSPIHVKAPANFACGSDTLEPSPAPSPIDDCGVTSAATTRQVLVNGADADRRPGKPPGGTDIPPGEWKDTGIAALDTTSWPESPGSPACRNELVHGGGVCAHWKAPTLSATPWGGPQPEGNPCVGCSGKPGSGVVFLTLDPNFTIEGMAPGALTDVSLIVGTDVTDTDWNMATGSNKRYNLNGLTLDFTTNNVAKVCVDLEETDSILLTMNVATLSGERSIVSPILTLPKAADADYEAEDYACVTP